MQSRQLRSLALAATGAAILAHGALAAGEPKNEAPFTRPVAARSLSQTSHSATTPPQIRGEAKNELPFTRPVSTPPTLIVKTRGGFNFTDGAIGALAGIGVALSAAAALALARKSPRFA